MLIKRPDDIKSSEITDKKVYLNRRLFMRGAVLAARRLLKGNPAEISERIDAEARIFAERLRSPEAQAAFAGFLGKGRS